MFLLIFIAVLSSANAMEADRPTQCFEISSTMQELMQCLTTFIGCSPTIQPYISPTAADREAFQQVTEQLLSMQSSSRDCSSQILPPIIGSFVSLRQFFDQSQNKSYCVLFEHLLSQGRQFSRGWVIFAVPINELTPTGPNSEPTEPQTQWNLHLSTPHSESDGPVQIQTATLFAEINATSMLVTASCRNASAPQYSSCQTKFFASDGAHDTDSIFHAVNLQLMQWQIRQPGGCHRNTCAFVQFHGKAPTTCRNYDVFMSSGLRNNSAYDNCSLPIRRLQNALKTAAPDWSVATPADGVCRLQALDNVFGRVLNGVPTGEECRQKSTSQTFTGRFVHVEQAYIPRNPGGYKAWAAAMKRAFAGATLFNENDEKTEATFSTLSTEAEDVCLKTAQKNGAAELTKKFDRKLVLIILPCLIVRFGIALVKTMLSTVDLTTDYDIA